MPLYQVALHGTLASIAEIFTHTLAINSTAPAEGLALEVLTEFEEAFTDASIGWQAATSNTVTYTHATAAEILTLTDPNPALAAASRANATTPFSGSGASQIPQAALAVTLVAGTYPNGTPLRGRYYLPVPSTSQLQTGSGLLTTAAQTLFLEGQSNFLDRLSSLGHTPCVWSRKLGSLQIVDTVSVGNRVDTIRSRRNAGLEDYSSLPVPTPPG